MTASDLKRYQQDPVAFIEECLIEPETGRPFELYPEQKIFMRQAVKLTTDGKLLYTELIFGAPKKSGKTTLAALILIYVIVVLGGRFAEAYCIANDLEQSQGRVFQAIVRIVEASSLLKRNANITQSKIIFLSTGATITALASDYAGAAGANPNISVFDELWGYTSERTHRLWDEMVPPPTRKIACRFTVTYAGFESESVLLEGLYKKAMSGQKTGDYLYEIPGQMLCYWTHELRAPWQTVEWQEQMRGQLRPNAFLRMIENRWVSTESDFVPVEWWDRAAIGNPVVADRIPVILGVDAGLKRDSAAVVACTYDPTAKKVRVINHRIFYPQKGETLDIEDTLEETVRDFVRRYDVREVSYDPWQFQRSAQTLTKEGIPMLEYPQSVPNLTAATQNLFELFKGENLLAYPDAEIRLAIQRAVTVETARGMRITKEKASHKIDVVVALAMAAHGAVLNLSQHPQDVGPVYVEERQPPSWIDLERRYDDEYQSDWDV